MQAHSDILVTTVGYVTLCIWNKAYLSPILRYEQCDITFDRWMNLDLFVYFQEDFDRLRVLAYMNCDVFFVCFSVVKPDSCKHVEEVWIPEIKHYMPTTPFILVGTQTDMRDSLNASGMDTVSAKEGAELARRVEADCYVEISSRTDSGIQQAIEESIAVALSSAASASKDCDCKCRCQIIWMLWQVVVCLLSANCARAAFPRGVSLLMLSCACVNHLEMWNSSEMLLPTIMILRPWSGKLPVFTKTVTVYQLKVVYLPYVLSAMVSVYSN